ncbi:hypothetical protein Gpo141_00013326 [Globisporangium polare]
MPGAATAKSAAEKLRDVQDFMASESASTQEKVDRMVSFLADGLAGGDESPRVAMMSDGDIVADTLANEQARQEALLKELGGTSAAVLAADTEDRGESSRVVLANDPPKDLVADALAHKNAEEEALLKKLTSGGLMANDDEDELVEQIIDSLASTNEGPQGDALLDAEASTTVDGQPLSKGDPELVDQVIDALANTNDGAEEGALLTSEFNGETSGDVKLEGRESAADMVGQVTQHLADASEPNSNEALLATRHSGDLDGLSQLLAKDTATADEKVDQVVAFLASATERELSTGAPAALALEATTATSISQLRAPATLAVSMEQDHLPHMMFGGAFLLVAAVLLTVMTKRSRGTRPGASAHDEAYAYFLHE